ncbi:ABC transporter permease [Thermococcus sp.]|uniref:ABC transporter permease n=1 Tax=Thermococcus sp. TaxID=35749 RepID=UPI002619C77B|nr:ABC transporter permease [Thermococcus sp.]
MSAFETGFWVVFVEELRRILRSRRFKVLFAVTFFPSLIYLLSPNPIGEGVEPMLKAFEAMMLDLLPNYWLGIIGQLIAIILMCDLLASEMDRGTIRLLLAKPLRLSELVAAKFLAGISALAVLFGIPYATVWLYNPVVYKTGLDGLWKGLPDLLLVLGVSVLILALLGALSMLVSVLISRPLYASLATFGIVFVLQFLFPQIPYLQNAERYTLSYQTAVLLKAGFERVDLSGFAGVPAHSAAIFLALTVAMLLPAWAILVRRDFPD